MVCRCCRLHLRSIRFASPASVVRICQDFSKYPPSRGLFNPYMQPSTRATFMGLPRAAQPSLSTVSSGTDQPWHRSGHSKYISPPVLHHPEQDIQQEPQHQPALQPRFVQVQVEVWSLAVEVLDGGPSSAWQRNPYPNRLFLNGLPQQTPPDTRKTYIISGFQGDTSSLEAALQSCLCQSGVWAAADFPTNSTGCACAVVCAAAATAAAATAAAVVAAVVARPGAVAAARAVVVAAAAAVRTLAAAAAVAAVPPPAASAAAAAAPVSPRAATASVVPWAVAGAASHWGLPTSPCLARRCLAICPPLTAAPAPHRHPWDRDASWSTASHNAAHTRSPMLVAQHRRTHDPLTPVQPEGGRGQQ